MTKKQEIYIYIFLENTTFKKKTKHFQQKTPVDLNSRCVVQKIYALDQ